MPTVIDASGLADGTYSIVDDGIAGNGISVVRDASNTILTTFVHPVDSLTILSRTGQSLSFDFTDSLTAADFIVGSLTNAAVRADAINIANVQTSGTVTLTATGLISELNPDSGTDIIAGSLLLDAGTGIGVGNALETQVSVLEAESVTGDILIDNIGNVQIGGATAELVGLRTATSGNIVLNNQGSITLADTDGVESMRSAGDLTLNALGATSDISSIVNRDALLAVGNMSLNAGQDVVFGRGGADFDNDIRAGGSITISAGRDFTIDGFADLAADDQGLASGGGVSITAGRDINITNVNGTDASVGVSGTGTGSVVLTTGIGGTLTMTAQSSATVFAASGGVELNTDRLIISASSGVTANAGGTVSISTVTDGRAINLGSLLDGVTALELSDAELDRIVTTSLIVGSETSGDVSVTAALTVTQANFEIRSGSDIAVQSDIVSAGTVTLRADGDFTLTGAATITADLFHVFVDQDGSADANGAVASLEGVVATVSTLTGNVDADTLTGNDGINVLGGGRGKDTLVAGAGADTLIGGRGADKLDGGADFDLASYEDAAAGVRADLHKPGRNKGDAKGDQFTSIEGLAGSDFADRLAGDGAANTLMGGDGNDKLLGRGASDTLQGDEGRDKLNGGGGEDSLFGGEGGDRLKGGGAADLFVFTAITDSGIAGKARDTILDFERGQSDRIDLAGIDAIGGTPADDAFTFIGSAAFNNVAGELRFEKKNGDTLVSGDVDGDGTADFSIRIDGKINLQDTDFVL